MSTNDGQSRRDFLKQVSVGAFAAATGIPLAGCDDDSGGDMEETAPQVAFDTGVASGDPLADRVILWTRPVPADPEAVNQVRVRWEIATDEAFDEVVNSDRVETTAERDYTVKVDADGLSPGQIYYYRFRVGDQVSPTGRTKTLPIGNIRQARFALFSCSNYPAGFFHAYHQAAQDDFDAVIHVGDYIYEYPVDGFASQDAERLGRVSEPPTELFSVQDYRTRYAQYRSDPDLQRMHADFPWIVVWDDHEVANDTYENGAENHNDGEGDFKERRQMAIQAYHEWLPIRTPNPENRLEIFRRFEFGDLLTLHMLDTRQLARDEQLALDDPEFASKVADRNRQLLGESQMGWLQEGLQNSAATWQVIGQQVIMGRLVLPQSILAASFDENGAPDAVGFNTALTEYLTSLQTPPEMRTPQQQALLDPEQNPLVPFNPDAWDGYVAAREQVLGTAVQAGQNLVVLSGDSHNSWALNLRTFGTDGTDGVSAGVEFAGTSVSSPGLEGPSAFGLDATGAAELAGALTQLVPELAYVNVFNRGFVAVTFTQEQAEAEYIHGDTVKQAEFEAPEALRKRMRVQVNTNQLTDPGAGAP